MNWTRGRTTGRSSTAAVSLSACCYSDKTFALKSTDIPRSKPLQNEARVLSTLDSPNIVGYRGCDVTQENDGLVFNLFLEYLPAGSLSDAMRKQGRLEEDVIAQYTLQILIGLDYLHSRGIVHCDVKPSNILIGHRNCAKSRISDAQRAEAEPAAIGGCTWRRRRLVGWSRGALLTSGLSVASSKRWPRPWAGVGDPVSTVHKTVYSGESPELSPTSLMDQEFWDSAEVTGQARATSQSTSNCESSNT